MLPPRGTHFSGPEGPRAGSHGPWVRVGTRATWTHTDRHRHPPWDPTRRRSGQEKLVPGAGNTASVYCEGAEPNSVPGVVQLRGFEGGLGRNPETMTKTGSKSWLGLLSKPAENPPIIPDAPP